uniref:WW domain binding protein VOPP1 n=1 Tax=Stomoxys calcitrans TaxID=35570 RepID=A0A1I8Q871_STOCA
MHLYLAFIFGISIQMSKFVAARFCEGGHICSLPRECCTQGCCPPYQSGPRQLPPPSEHVLNLFFISHWFFWCVVVAIILAILCAYSLWKKRRTLCGWGFNEHHAQSEGDSAGSCYAPPQYSRCNSFHHPPPPYTEVTSKPDLYPLVFTCNSDNGKNGSSYLMVQYFRNYIVRPAGSLSAASTVDSLSSSFICNINEANTLVPPPYSRAASPEIGFSSHFQQQYMMPRSASQLVCQNVSNSNFIGSGGNGAGLVSSGNGQFELSNSPQMYSSRSSNTHYATVTVNATVNRLNSSATGGDRVRERVTNFNGNQLDYESTLSYEDAPESDERTNDNINANVINCSSSSNDLRTLPNSTGFVQSQSDQHFRYITNSNSSISDIFVNNSCAAGIGGGGSNRLHRSEDSSIVGSITGVGASAAVVHPQAGGTPVIYSNGCIKPIPLHRASTNPTQFHVDASSNREAVLYQSNNSIGGISITVPTGIEDSAIICNDNEIRDLQLLRRSLETCCQLLQQQQKIPAGGFALGESPLRMNELAKKYIDEGLLRSYVTSGTCSGVSSLANIGTPSSPPQATSPTGEVKEILDQIRQLQEGVTKYEEDLAFRSVGRPTLHHTLSSPAPTVNRTTPHLADSGGKLQRISTMPEQQSLAEAAKANILVRSIASNSPTNSMTSVPSTSSVLVGTQPNKLTNSKSSLSGGGSGSGSASAIGGFIFSSSTSKRPSTLQHSKKRFYTSKPPNKAMYIPMMATNQVPTSSRCTMLKSPVTSVVNSNFFTNRGNRQRKCWISRSAPTTPATPLPPSYMDDDSPLLNEQDEDQEGEQNAEMDS